MINEPLPTLLNPSADTSSACPFALARDDSLPVFWTLARLAEAFERVSDKQGGAGADEQTLAEFSVNADAQLGLLALQLGQGSYRPGPLHFIPMAKPGGGVRELLVPAVRDRVAQAAFAASPHSPRTGLQRGEPRLPSRPFRGNRASPPRGPA